MLGTKAAGCLERAGNHGENVEKCRISGARKGLKTWRRSGKMPHHRKPEEEEDDDDDDDEDDESYDDEPYDDEPYDDEPYD